MITFLLYVIVALVICNGIFIFLWSAESKKNIEKDEHERSIKAKILEVKNEDSPTTIDDLIDDFNIL